MNGTHCFKIDKLGLFCSEFLSVNNLRSDVFFSFFWKEGEKNTPDTFI